MIDKTVVTGSISARLDANEATRSLTKLSIGKRVVSARDDAASMAIGSRMNSEVQGLKQAVVNAGHLPPMLFRDGKVSELDVNGMVVGAFPFAQYGESQVKLESGDVLLVFTDGITETRSPRDEFFGESRLFDLVKENRERSAAELVDVVFGAAGDFRADRALGDDLTVVVLRAVDSD